MVDVLQFQGEYRFLSNFWPAKVKLGGIYYPSVENAFQAAKTLDLDKRKWFLDVPAGEAKRIGQNLDLRPDWEAVKLLVMNYLVRQKFSDTLLHKKLFSTAPGKLVEGNYWHDQFWGDCICSKHISIPGENHLGLILMKVRDGVV
jgi:ribA/ribD-fused uncharacterized protein